MKNPITTTLDASLVDFLTREAKRQKVNRNDILEKALKFYKNFLLAKEVKEGLLDRQEEYRDMAQELSFAQQYALRHLS
jgi:hypothetical protein